MTEPREIWVSIDLDFVEVYTPADYESFSEAEREGLVLFREVRVEKGHAPNG